MYLYIYVHVQLDSWHVAQPAYSSIAQYFNYCHYRWFTNNGPDQPVLTSSKCDSEKAEEKAAAVDQEET